MPQPVTPSPIPERPARAALAPLAAVIVSDARWGRALAMGAGVVGLVVVGALPLAKLSAGALAAAFLALPLGALVVMRVGWRVLSVHRTLIVTADDEGLSMAYPRAAWGGAACRVTPWAELPPPAIVATELAGVEGLELRLPDGRKRFFSAREPGFPAFAAAVFDRWPGGEAAMRAHSLRVTQARIRRQVWGNVLLLLLPSVAVSVLLRAGGLTSSLGAVAAGALVPAVGIGVLLNELRRKGAWRAVFPDRSGSPPAPHP